MKLAELFAIARKAYGHPSDDEIGNHLNEAGDTIVPEPYGAGDQLALFLLYELRDTYDADASDTDQIAEAIRVMRMCKDDIGNVVRALRTFQEERIKTGLHQRQKEAIVDAAIGLLNNLDDTGQSVHNGAEHADVAELRKAVNDYTKRR